MIKSLVFQGQIWSRNLQKATVTANTKDHYLDCLRVMDNESSGTLPRRLALTDIHHIQVENVPILAEYDSYFYTTDWSTQDEPVYLLAMEFMSDGQAHFIVVKQSQVNVKWGGN